MKIFKYEGPLAILLVCLLLYGTFLCATEFQAQPPRPQQFPVETTIFQEVPPLHPAARTIPPTRPQPPAQQPSAELITEEPVAPLTTTLTTSPSLWLTPSQIAALPINTPAWNYVKTSADKTGFDSAVLTERNNHGSQVYAAALVAARLNSPSYRAKVRDELAKTMAKPVTDDLLDACRSIGLYAIAADVADMNNFDPPFAGKFKLYLQTELRRKYWDESVINIQEKRANNWAMHATASRIAVAIYTGDTQDLTKAVILLRKWLGLEPTVNHTFSWHGDAKTWMPDPNKPVGINPLNSIIRYGNPPKVASVGGILPGDIERYGAFHWPPKKSGDGIQYSYGALGPLTVSLLILQRNGYPDANLWADKGLLRAYKALYVTIGAPAYGDYRFQIDLLRYLYGNEASFAPLPSSPNQFGKSMSFTDWTHRGRTVLASNGQTEPPVTPPVTPPVPPTVPIDPPELVEARKTIIKLTADLVDANALSENKSATIRTLETKIVNAVEALK